ncbi:MAG: hypothetical protein AAGI66_02205 [Cyanobacteria bacterium P01_H01_bin.74]
MTEPKNLTQSKLFIRSEVTSAIDSIKLIINPTRNDKLKQLKRLQDISDRKSVLDILLKELQRSKSNTVMQIITELLMELGTIESLRDPLWCIIQSNHCSDEVKDAANIVLRQLGDATDPSVYLDYLEDPAGLINRETERMLEVSAKNPEALIDFIDFIFSLPTDEQINLLSSLKEDYSVEHILNLILPTILAKPPREVLELLLPTLGETKHPRAAEFLDQYSHWFESDAGLSKIAKTARSKLRLSGVEQDKNANEAGQHSLLVDAELFKIFATIPDGIGNMALIYSRQHTNGEIAMMSAVVSDLHGIVDCFGFYDLSQTDFYKLLEKFHEESTKVEVSETYFLQQLESAEKLNTENKLRIPYEYSCWKMMLPKLLASRIDPHAIAKALAKQEWEDATARLYHHPDVCTWFLEEGDNAIITPVLDSVLSVCQSQLDAMAIDEAGAGGSAEDPDPGQVRAFVNELTTLAETLVSKLLQSQWRNTMINRLSDCAYLFKEQQTHTFSTLAATEAYKLMRHTPDETPINGFIQHYGRRCIEEDLLRLKLDFKMSQEPKKAALFETLVLSVLQAWEI